MVATEFDANKNAERIMTVYGFPCAATLDQENKTKRAAYRLSEEDIALIFVGGICARKDPMFLVEQMPAICAFNRHVKLLIVGPVLEADYHARMLDDTGFFFTTAEDYLARVRKLIEDRLLRRQMGAAARNLIAAEFNDLKNAAQIMQIYALEDEKRRSW